MRGDTYTKLVDAAKFLGATEFNSIGSGEYQIKFDLIPDLIVAEEPDGLGVKCSCRSSTKNGMICHNYSVLLYIEIKNFHPVIDPFHELLTGVIEHHKDLKKEAES